MSKQVVLVSASWAGLHHPFLPIVYTPAVPPRITEGLPHNTCCLKVPLQTSSLDHLTVGWDPMCDIHYLTLGSLHLTLQSEAIGTGWSLIHPGFAPVDTFGTSMPRNPEVSEATCGLAHSFSEMDRLR